MQKVFYDSVLTRQIIDISGNKTKAQIASEFNTQEDNLQEIFITQNECAIIKDGVLIKKDITAERIANEAIRKIELEVKQKPIIDKLKVLGFTEEEIKTLLEK